MLRDHVKKVIFPYSNLILYCQIFTDSIRLIQGFPGLIGRIPAVRQCEFWRSGGSFHLITTPSSPYLYIYGAVAHTFVPQSTVLVYFLLSFLYQTIPC